MSKNERLFRIKYHGESILSFNINNILDKRTLDFIEHPDGGLFHVFEVFKLQAECFGDDFVLDSVEEIDG